MIHIMLCCASGMSTSLLVEKMIKAAEEQGIKADIWAVGANEVKANAEKADVILTNDDGKVIKKHHYSYTDCPDGEYVFYMFWKEQEKPILIYSSEY